MNNDAPLDPHRRMVAAIKDTSAALQRLHTAFYCLNLSVIDLAQKRSEGKETRHAEIAAAAIARAARS